MLLQHRYEGYTLMTDMTIVPPGSTRSEMTEIETSDRLRLGNSARLLPLSTTASAFVIERYICRDTSCTRLGRCLNPGCLASKYFTDGAIHDKIWICSSLLRQSTVWSYLKSLVTLGVSWTHAVFEWRSDNAYEQPLPERLRRILKVNLRCKPKIKTYSGLRAFLHAQSLWHVLDRVWLSNIRVCATTNIFLNKICELTEDVRLLGDAVDHSNLSGSVLHHSMTGGRIGTVSSREWWNTNSECSVCKCSTARTYTLPVILKRSLRRLEPHFESLERATWMHCYAPILVFQSLSSRFERAIRSSRIILCPLAPSWKIKWAEDEGPWLLSSTKAPAGTCLKYNSTVPLTIPKEL